MGKIKILAVDDEKNILKLYKSCLKENGFAVETAENGKAALKKAASTFPDAILLDLMMPVMDGLTACKKIKKDKRTKDIPIIIVSAKNSTKDIINGLKAGADEYLTKPFHVEELLLRINSMVKLKKTVDELKNINLNLEKEVKQKTEQLLEASRFGLLGRMATGLGHDLNNLLTGITFYNNLEENAEDIKTIRVFLDKQASHLNLCKNFVKNLLNFSRVQRPILTIFDPREAVETTLGILSNKLEKYNINYEIIDEKTLIHGDEGLFTQVCLNIISNAVDSMMKECGKLTVKIKYDGDYTSVSFTDTGCGIKKSDQKKIFDYLYTTKKSKKTAGIGLYITKRIIERLKGDIRLTSKEGKGSTFTVLLPSGKKELNI